MRMGTRFLTIIVHWVLRAPGMNLTALKYCSHCPLLSLPLGKKVDAAAVKQGKASAGTTKGSWDDTLKKYMPDHEPRSAHFPWASMFKEGEGM